jgi:multidrug efflux pump subunit AcrA (membrane-fusion protein)
MQYIQTISEGFQTLGRYVRLHPLPMAVLFIVLIVVAVLFFRGVGDSAPEQESERLSLVRVASIAALAFDAEPLILLGEVRSVSQAELRTGRSGTVSRIYTQAGRFVQAGTILAEIDSASERARVLSAQGALEAAEANLARVLAGARAEDRLSASAQAEGAGTALSSVQESARNAYLQSYALAADAVFAQTDTFFSNPYTVYPMFRITSATFDERQALGRERYAMGEILETWRQRSQEDISLTALDPLLSDAQRDLALIAAFLTEVSRFIAKQEVTVYLPSEMKAGQEARIAGARSAVSSAQGAIASSRQGLAGAESARTSALLTEEVLAIGPRDEDVRSAQAGVTQARGALAGAFADLENALIRTPIAGTVTTFNISMGDFVSAQQSVAVVANPGALEIEVFVTASALARITPGMAALIAGKYEGAVATRSPGLDPLTKRARVTIQVPETAQLVNGSFVEVALLEADGDERTAVEQGRDGLSVPLRAIKVLPRGLAVFTVDEEGIVQALPVVEGPIVGTRMLIRGDIDPDLRIITDARGIQEGMQVEVETDR